MVVFMAGIVVVSSADRATMFAFFAFTVSMNFSGATFTPRSMTSKPAPSNIAATRFLPMSCKSPFTVPMTTRASGWAPL
jgi:hypothetical protein